MIQAKAITLIRFEGPINETDKPITFHADKGNVWDQAQSELTKWSRTAPKLGYDKCRFEILYEDGHQFNGRIDIQHPEIHLTNFIGELRHMVSVYAGENKPPKMSQKRYAEFVKEMDGDNWLLLMKNYSIGS